MQQEPSIPSSPQTTTLYEPNVGGESNNSNRWKGAASTIAILIAAPIIAILLTSFVFQSYEVDGQSMETTLQDRDRLIVWKLPHTISKITKNHYIPSRGDVVIFVKHEFYDNTNTPDKQLIKRVIGVPGDRVVVNNNHITVYNDEHPDGFDPDVGQEFSNNIAKPTTGNVDVTVQEGEIFVNGDNRTNSLDSRIFGVVKSEDIVGKMILRIFPLDNAKSFI